jgi:hypothetical protein
MEWQARKLLANVVYVEMDWCRDEIKYTQYANTYIVYRVYSNGANGAGIKAMMSPHAHFVVIHCTMKMRKMMNKKVNKRPMSKW